MPARAARRRIQAAIDLYGDGRISREEYLRRVERNERELASWQLRTTESEQLALELGMCLQTVEHLNRMWAVATDEDRQGMVRHLFEEIAYDLDRRQIVDFRLKPWAEHFLFLRTELYAQEQDALEGHENRVTPAGYEHRGFLLSELARTVLKRAGVFVDVLRPPSRPEQIRQRYASGERLSDLAREYGISPQRVWQIVTGS